MRSRTRFAAEPPPETTRVRRLGFKFRASAWRPQYVAEDLLKRRGVHRRRSTSRRPWRASGSKALASGEVDIAMHFAAPLSSRLDARRPDRRPGRCARRLLRAVRDGPRSRDPGPEGKDGRRHRIGVGPARLPRQHGGATWAWTRARTSTGSTHPAAEGKRLLAEGKIDAFLGFRRTRRSCAPGRSVTWSSTARSTGRGRSTSAAWSTANREFVRKHPVATKRALRAILKAADICALEPERAARGSRRRRASTPRLRLCAAGDEGGSLRQVARVRPRGYGPLLRPRLHEAGMIKASPQKIIAQGTDWRFLNELKKELKG